MKTICGIGDLHISNKQYYVEAYDKLLAWLSSQDFGCLRDELELFLVGDIFNSINITADIAAMFKRLVEVLYSKASKIYAIMGNHDYGISSYIVESAKGLLESYGICVIDKPCEITTDNGFKVLCFPWTQESISKSKQFMKSIDLSKQYDVLATHWYVTTPKFMNGDQSSILEIPPELKVTSVFAGHIHNTGESDLYLGSVLPNAADDDKWANPSVLKIVSNGKETKKTIPPFVKFVTVDIDKSQDVEDADGVWYILEYSQASSLQLRTVTQHVKRLYKVVSKSSDDGTLANASDISAVNGKISKRELAYKYLDSVKANVSQKVIEYCLQKVS